MQSLRNFFECVRLKRLAFEFIRCDQSLLLPDMLPGNPGSRAVRCEVRYFERGGDLRSIVVFPGNNEFGSALIGELLHAER